MWIHLLNGRAFHLADANRYELSDDKRFLTVRGDRNRYIATFSVESIAGWYYDCEEVTTYTATDNVEQLT